MRKNLLVVLLLLAGCAENHTRHTAEKYYTSEDSKFIKANYTAAESLIKTSRIPLGKSAPVIVATLVNIDNLEQSSTLGRTVSEQVATRLANLGYMVKEVKLRGTLFVKSATGELLLSRELKDISASHKAQAVVVGTYADANEYVFLNIKLIDADNTVLSGYDYAIPVDPVNKNLMGSR